MDTYRYFSKTQEPHYPAWLRHLNMRRTRFTGLPSLGEAFRRLGAVSWLARLLPKKVIPSDLGTFDAYDAETGVKLTECLSPHAVSNWDSASRWMAEFTPAGDRLEVNLLFDGKHHEPITGWRLLALDYLLQDLGGDTTENFLKVYFAVRVQHGDLLTLTKEAIEERGIRVFFGIDRADLLRAAAVELFAQCYPEHFAIWHRTGHALKFDRRAFFRSRCFQCRFVDVGNRLALVVAACCLRPTCLKNQCRQACQPADPTSFLRRPGAAAPCRAGSHKSQN